MNLKIELNKEDVRSIIKSYIEQEVSTKKVASVEFIIEQSYDHTDRPTGWWHLDKTVVTKTVVTLK